MKSHLAQDEEAVQVVWPRVVLVIVYPVLLVWMMLRNT